jgi:hypothetical protein
MMVTMINKGSIFYQMVHFMIQMGTILILKVMMSLEDIMIKMDHINLVKRIKISARKYNRIIVTMKMEKMNSTDSLKIVRQ